jgi:hypothetical protein
MNQARHRNKILALIISNYFLLKSLMNKLRSFNGNNLEIMLIKYKKIGK